MQCTAERCHPLARSETLPRPAVHRCAPPVSALPRIAMLGTALHFSAVHRPALLRHSGHSQASHRFAMRGITTPHPAPPNLARTGLTRPRYTLPSIATPYSVEHRVGSPNQTSLRAAEPLSASQGITMHCVAGLRLSKDGRATRRHASANRALQYLAKPRLGQPCGAVPMFAPHCTASAGCAPPYPAPHSRA